MVPNIISTKDLSYLTDIFEWNFVAGKSSYTNSLNCNIPSIKDILIKGHEIFNSNCDDVISILGGNYE